MKKIYFLFILILSFTVSQAQTYYPFPTDSAEWGVRVTCQVPVCPLGTIVYPYQTSQKGDTLINGLFYHKLYNKQNNNLHSFYREANKKIYSKYPLGSVFSNDTSEFVLYDFNINIGDTFIVKVPANWINTGGPITTQPKIVLTSTTTINVNSISHKAYNFMNNGTPCVGSITWIEGVGSTSGLFYNLNTKPWSVCLSYPAPYDVFLTCFSRNYYVYPYTVNSCVTGIEEINKTQLSFKVFPNPSNGLFKIEINDKNSSAKRISIKNILGQTIFTIDTPSSELSIDQFHKGIYFITLMYSDKTETQKLIVD